MNKLYGSLFVLLMFCQNVRCEAPAAIGDRKVERFTVKTVGGWTLNIESPSGYLIYGSSSFNGASFEGISPQKAFAALLPDLDLAPRTPEESKELILKNGVYITVWFADANDKEVFPLSKSNAVCDLIDAAATVWQPASASRFSELLTKFPIFPSWQPSVSRGNKVRESFLKSE